MLVWYAIVVSVVLGVYSSSSRQARYESSIDRAVRTPQGGCLDRRLISIGLWSLQGSCPDTKRIPSRILCIICPLENDLSTEVASAWLWCSVGGLPRSERSSSRIRVSVGWLSQCECVIGWLESVGKSAIRFIHSGDILGRFDVDVVLLLA